MSQNTGINESIIVAKRHDGPKPPTRFINLDKFPVDDKEVADLHDCLDLCAKGPIHNGWGEVSEWPSERIAAGDWTPTIWRSPGLAEASNRYANHPDLRSIKAAGLSAQATGQQLRGSYEPAETSTPGSFPILKSKGADSQTTIQSVPDEHWIPKQRNPEVLELNNGVYPEAKPILQKAGHLLITAGQRTNTARLTATASDERYAGSGWMPVTGLSAQEAKAIAVYINSTVGRLQLMRTPGKTIDFPTYSVAEAENIRIPDVKDDRVRQVLADCWEQTKDTKVPQFRDGECEVRQLWDEAVAEAMGWDTKELAQLRHLLNSEPHVRGLGYGQYGDEAVE